MCLVELTPSPLFILAPVPALQAAPRGDTGSTPTMFRVVMITAYASSAVATVSLTHQASSNDLSAGINLSSLKASWKSPINVKGVQANLEATYDAKANDKFLNDAKLTGSIPAGPVKFAYTIAHKFGPRQFAYKLVAKSGFGIDGDFPCRPDNCISLVLTPAFPGVGSDGPNAV